MKNVVGFLADDGVFFERKSDAELHEAEAALRETMLLNGIVSDSFIELVQQHLSQTERYINAYKATQANISQTAEAASIGEVKLTWEGNRYDPTVSLDPAKFYTRQSDVPVFGKPSDSGKPVSDLGSSTQSENVRDDGKGDGS